MNDSASPTTLILISSLIGMFLIVPGRDIKRFRKFGFWGGAVIGLAVLALGGPLLKLWRFHDRAQISGVPLMLGLSWYPAEIIFAYAFDVLERWHQRIGLILGIAASAMLIFHYLTSIGVWETLVPIKRIWFFLFSTAIHTGLAVYLRLHQRKKGGGRTSIPPLF